MSLKLVMRKTIPLSLIAIMFCVVNMIGFANNTHKNKFLIATASGIHGTGVDYFTSAPTTSTLPLHRFNTRQKDGTSSKVVFAWEVGNKTATLTFYPSKSQSHALQANLHVIYFEDGQLTAVGILHGAPVMFSVYPFDKVCVYSMQSIWQGLLNGMRSTLFYNKCTVEVSSQKP